MQQQVRAIIAQSDRFNSETKQNILETFFWSSASTKDYATMKLIVDKGFKLVRPNIYNMHLLTCDLDIFTFIVQQESVDLQQVLNNMDTCSKVLDEDAPSTHAYKQSIPAKLAVTQAAYYMRSALQSLKK